MTLNFNGRPLHVSDDVRLILIVLSTGALGSYVHAATSFASYVGNRRLVLSWTLWYVLRPFIGMALALIFYFVLRGGLLSTSASSTELSVFGIAAVAGLVGMFSKQATDKLRELFDNLFRTEQGQGDDARADKLGGKVRVATAMIERRKIAGYTIPSGKSPADVRMVDLHQMLGGVITRIPVFDHEDHALCVIHQSLLYKFLADQGIASMKGPPTFDATRYTLADLLEAPGIRELVQDSLAFVPEGATMADAKEHLEHTPNCLDLFVTEHGLPHEPVIGWVTDTEVRRSAKG